MNRQYNLRTAVINQPPPLASIIDVTPPAATIDAFSVSPKTRLIMRALTWHLVQQIIADLEPAVALPTHNFGGRLVWV